MVQIISGHVLIFAVTVLSVHMKLHSEEINLTKCDFHLQVDMSQGAVQSLFLSNDQQPAEFLPSRSLQRCVVLLRSAGIEETLVFLPGNCQLGQFLSLIVIKLLLRFHISRKTIVFR